MVGVFCRDAVTITLKVDQRRAGQAYRLLDVAVERLGNRHHLHLLILQQLGDGQCGPFRVGHASPGVLALVGHPGVEFIQIFPALLASGLPYLPTSILYIFLNTPFLPARGPVAKLGVEQVMTAQSVKARVDVALLAGFDLVDRRLHVVVPAASLNLATPS